MKKQTKISEETLKIIQSKEIKPIPKWEFVAKNWLLWLMILGSLMLAIVGSSLSWFGLAGEEIEPYMGMILAGVFALGAYGLFERTKKAYRIQRWQVLGAIVIIGVVSGGIFYVTGMARNIDRGLEKNVPYYRNLAPLKVETWSQPENGRLSGKIEKILGNKRMEISDFEGKSWVVDFGQALVRGRVEMLVGEEIKVIGVMVQNGVFEASEIRPWMGRMEIE
jgi:4-amino-4-deoxy-L-arabinose transferase-like glycosyltransferase